MITADTITDDQISELLLSVESEIARSVPRTRAERKQLTVVRDTCITARYEFEYPSARIAARARCASILNARTAK
jgi:hypothetical protein